MLVNMTAGEHGLYQSPWFGGPCPYRRLREHSLGTASALPPGLAKASNAAPPPFCMGCHGLMLRLMPTLRSGREPLDGPAAAPVRCCIPLPLRSVYPLPLGACFTHMLILLYGVAGRNPISSKMRECTSSSRLL